MKSRGLVFALLSVLSCHVVASPLAPPKTVKKSAAKPPVKAPSKPPVKPSTPDPSDAFFSSGKVVQISIELGKEELNSLRGDMRKYVQCTLTEGDKVYQKVAIHLKGAAGSTRSVDDKPGLTLNMDKFVKGQKFYGMGKFHLSNSVQDPSYVSELLCGEMFREAGVPASRIAHAVVAINGRNRGLYYLKEGYDSHFLKKNFGTADGNFYDGGFLRDIDQPLELNSGKKDVKDQADLKALAASCQEPDPKKRFEKVAKLLDMDRFISYLVLEMVTWDWDGYAMNRNNYRIYHDPTRDKIVFLPSGMDQMFSDPHGPVFPGFQGMVARAVIETPEGKTRYLTRLREILKTVYRAEARLKRLNEQEAKLKPYLSEMDEGAGNDYPNQINRLRQAIQERAKSIEEQLQSNPS